MLSTCGLLLTRSIEALLSTCYEDSLDAWGPGLGEKREELLLVECWLVTRQLFHNGIEHLLPITLVVHFSSKLCKIFLALISEMQCRHSITCSDCMLYVRYLVQHICRALSARRPGLQTSWNQTLLSLDMLGIRKYTANSIPTLVPFGILINRYFVSKYGGAYQIYSEVFHHRGWSQCCKGVIDKYSVIARR